MDQNSFRQLLHTSGHTSSSTSTSTSCPNAHVRGSLLATASTSTGSKKQKTVDASQPAFKPRKLKKSGKGEDYRDRATERRQGLNNDFAQVEALAEDFERRNAENADREAVEEQRKYLGGDSVHTVLVKGLDFALLEQNRMRVAAEASVTEDALLEEALLESTTQLKKRARTREELLYDLKTKRGAPDAGANAPTVADKALEEAKKAGKFKPIGTSSTMEGKAKRKKKVKAGESEENGERKKKRKVAADAAAPATGSAGTSKAAEPSPKVPTSRPAMLSPAPGPEPIDEDFDIFAGAGEYTGIDLGDDDDDDDDDDADGGRASDVRQREDEEGEVRDEGPSRPRKWLTTSDDEREPSRPPSPAPERSHPSGSTSPPPRPDASHRPPLEDEDGQIEEEKQPMRLQPLASSAVPSIKELLAMDDEEGKAKKKRARKDKKKAGGGDGGGGAEKDTKAKVERDYQRLKAYTDKKAKT